jgi:hypothetical protein
MARILKAHQDVATAAKLGWNSRRAAKLAQKFHNFLREFTRQLFRRHWLQA